VNARDKERRFSILREIGCIACRAMFRMSPAEIHHLNLGGKAGQKRRGDEYTIPLCGWHHRSAITTGFTATSMRKMCGPSLARESKEFRRLYGTDDYLLAKVNGLVKKHESEAA
jgi:hypothetical protein